VKNRVISFGVMILALVTLLNGCSNVSKASDTINLPKGESKGQAEFTLSASLTDVPNNLLSYRIVHPIVTHESVATIGAKLGFFGEAATIDSSIIGMSKTGLNEILWINAKTGALEYTCVDKLIQTNSNLPGNDESLKIATEYLKQAGLWFPDIEAEMPIVGGSTNGVPSHLLIRFTRSIDGIPTTGPGNKLGIRIGDQGQVIRIQMWHPELEIYKNIEIIGPLEAFNNLEAAGGQTVVPTECNSVVIEDISLGYYMPGTNETQEYVMPVYIFKGKCLDEKGDCLQDYLFWVEAARK